MTTGDLVSVWFTCYGITAGRLRVYVGGKTGTIKTLDNNGTITNKCKNECIVLTPWYTMIQKINNYIVVFGTNNIQRLSSDGKKLWRNAE